MPTDLGETNTLYANSLFYSFYHRSVKLKGVQKKNLNFFFYAFYNNFLWFTVIRRNLLIIWHNTYSYWYFSCSLTWVVLFFVNYIVKMLKRHGDWLQWTIFLKFDVQKSFAHFSATMNPSEMVLYAKRTGESPLSRHIESCSWRFQNILWSFENILIYTNA